MKNEEIKRALSVILDKIDSNITNAWNDKLEDAQTVVTLEDFKKIPDEDDVPMGYDCDEDEDELGVVRYNGWLEELIKLRDEL